MDSAEPQLLKLSNEGNQAEWVAETYITQDTEAIFVVFLQVAFDCAEYFRVVVHGQYDWLLHLNPTL